MQGGGLEERCVLRSQQSARASVTGQTTIELKTPLRLAIILVVVGTCVGCDQITKSIARSDLTSGQPVTLLGGTVCLSYAENEGAFLGLGQGLPAQVRWWVLSAAVLALVTSLLVFALGAREISTSEVVASATVVGGGVANLIDRQCFGF